MCLESQLEKILNQNPNAKRWVVAYSGGLDSTVLLFLTHRLNQRVQVNKKLPVNKKTIVALHVNHQLSPQADVWSRHCQQQVESLGLSFEQVRVDVHVDGKGLEAAARLARYRVFENFLCAGDVLLLAHHQDDQAETLLLRLLRGAGVLGLSAMEQQRTLGKAVLLRPLLHVSRGQLENYAQTQKLHWVEDESNRCQDFDRNYLRHSVIPVLKQRWPQATRKLMQTAGLMQDSHALLQECAKDDLASLGQRDERWGASIDWKKLRHFSEVRRNNLLRFWCQQQQLTTPDAQILSEIGRQLFQSNSMLTGAIVSWSGCELRQYNHRLYLMSQLADFSLPALVNWDFSRAQSINLGSAGKLSLVDGDGLTAGLLLDVLPNSQLTIRWRQGGERCILDNRERSQLIKKLLQEYQLETWLRDRVPLIYSGEDLVAVADLWVCKGFSNLSSKAKILHWDISE